jgi:acetyl/propionyl-CoA carboxylase alpha subunit
VVVVGLAIPGYALVNKSRVESAHAAVAVPARVASLADRGYVDEIRVKPGQTVQRGDILMTARRRAEPAKAVSLTSDCSCTVLDVTVRHGDEVVAGQPLVLLGNADWGEPFIEALVRPDVEINVGQEVGVMVEGLPVVGRGRIARVDAERPAATRFGLAAVLREDPRYRLVLVSDISELRPLAPGAAARVRLRQDARWSELLAAEIERLAGSVTRLLGSDGGKRQRIPDSIG